MALIPDGPDRTRGKHAVTHYRTLQALDGAALIVECRLETGRTHQVRVHMSSIGHALLGDPVYGRTPSRLRPTSSKPDFIGRRCTRWELGSVHPVTGEDIRFTSPLPADLAALIVELAN